MFIYIFIAICVLPVVPSAEMRLDIFRLAREYQSRYLFSFFFISFYAPDLKFSLSIMILGRKHTVLVGFITTVLIRFVWTWNGIFESFIFVFSGRAWTLYVFPHSDDDHVLRKRYSLLWLYIIKSSANVRSKSYTRETDSKYKEVLTMSNADYWIFYNNFITL